jgi:hypothetical protein
MLVLLLVVVFNTSKLTHVFGSKVLVLVLVCYKLTLTPPSNTQCSHHLQKEEGIRSREQETGRGSQDGQWRNCCGVASQWLRVELQR